jgi:signal transduction protein with GAF and PtsI domain
MAKLKKFLVRKNDEIWGIFEYKEYQLKGETIFESVVEGEAFLLFVRPRPDISNALEERVAEKLKELMTYENEEKEWLQTCLEVLKSYGVPIEYEEDDD